MEPNKVDLPIEVQASLGLGQEQLASVQRYLGLQADLARRQRNVILSLCIIVASAFMVGQIAGGHPDPLPFERLAVAGLRFLALAATVLAAVFVAVLQLSSRRLRAQLAAQAVQLGLSAAQCDRVRKLGDALTRYVLFGPLALVGRKKV